MQYREINKEENKGGEQGRVYLNPSAGEKTGCEVNIHQLWVELGALHERENLPEGVDVKTLLRLN